MLNNKNCVKDLNLSTEQRAYIKEKISDFIEYFETKYPYANLPIAEMNILNDISTYALNKDFESAKNYVTKHQIVTRKGKIAPLCSTLLPFRDTLCIF